MNEDNFHEKDLVIKKLYKILGHVRILENVCVQTNSNDKLSKKITIFKIALNDAGKIIIQYYIKYCMDEIIKEYNKEELLKFNNLIDKVLRWFLVLLFNIVSMHSMLFLHTMHFILCSVLKYQDSFKTELIFYGIVKVKVIKVWNVYFNINVLLKVFYLSLENL